MNSLAQSNDILVETADLTRSYAEGGQELLVLDRINLQVRRGEVVALRGRSGSGKSTLLNLISGIDLPDSGSISVDGRNIVELDERDRTLYRRRKVGFVYQSFNLIPTLSVADNVRLVLQLNGVSGAEATSRAQAALSRVGLADRASSFPDILSGGEQQRVAIARAFVHGPSLILADEPTGNLDDESAATVLELLLELVNRDGATMIVATHSNSVAAIADRRLALVRGKLQDLDTAAS